MRSKLTFKYFAIPFIFCTTFVFADQVMALGKLFVICSPLEGELVYADGRPAADVRVKREWEWGGKGDSDEVRTDAGGNFSFPVVEKRSLFASLLPHQENIFQTYTAHDSSGQTEILKINKHNYTLHGEDEGRRLNVRCLVDAEPGSGNLFWGTCDTRN